MAQGVKIVGGAPCPGTFGVPGVEAIVDPTSGALRASMRPLEYQFDGLILGHYSVAASSGAATTISAGGAIFSFRWGAQNAYGVIERVTVGVAITTAFTTAQALDCDMIVNRAFTAADTGGTPITPTASTGKMRVNMGSSLAADVRICTTAALGAGTKTADGAAMAITPLAQGASNALGAGSVTDIYKIDFNGGHPLVLAANEGFNLRPVTTLGAVGVVKYYIRCEWAEVAAY